MVFGVGVSCRILYSIAICVYVSCSGPVTSVGEENANLSAIVYYTNLITCMWFLFGEVSSSSGCLGWLALFYCGTL